MGFMTDPNFSRPGAVDLSDLAANTQQGASAAGGTSFVTDVTEASFQELANDSMRYPIIVEFHSPRDTSGAATGQALATAVNAAGGRFLLARVNVDDEPRLAQALGVQAVPMVVALIGGQLAPLFQGTKNADEVQAVLEQVVQVAVANGMTGRAEPVAGPAPSAGEEPVEPPADPRFDAADEALAAGDFARAVEEFDKLLAATPNDPEVIAGRAQAALLERSTGFDPASIQAAASDGTDIAAQFTMADLEVIQNQPEPAFERLLAIAAQGDADLKERVRLRMLELFEVVGRTEPAVMKARRRLSSVLF